MKFLSLLFSLAFLFSTTVYAQKNDTIQVEITPLTNVVNADDILPFEVAVESTDAEFWQNIKIKPVSENGISYILNTKTREWTHDFTPLSEKLEIKVSGFIDKTTLWFEVLDLRSTQKYETNKLTIWNPNFTGYIEALNRSLLSLQAVQEEALTVALTPTESSFTPSSNSQQNLLSTNKKDLSIYALAFALAMIAGYWKGANGAPHTSFQSGKMVK